MTINTREIAKLADTNPAAEALLHYASIRERNARGGVSSFRAMRTELAKEGFEFTNQEFLSAIRHLEYLGVGQVKDGDSFVWLMPIRQLGKLFKSIQTLTGSTQKAEPKKAPTPPLNLPVIPRKSLVMCFGPTREVLIEFTSNLSQEDVDTLKEKMLQMLGI